MIVLEVTLCRRCASVFYNMDNRKITRKDYSFNAIKSYCDICRSFGFEYIVQSVDECEGILVVDSALFRGPGGP